AGAPARGRPRSSGPPRPRAGRRCAPPPAAPRPSGWAAPRRGRSPVGGSTRAAVVAGLDVGHLGGGADGAQLAGDLEPRGGGDEEGLALLAVGGGELGAVGRLHLGRGGADGDALVGLERLGRPAGGAE